MQKAKQRKKLTDKLDHFFKSSMRSKHSTTKTPHMITILDTAVSKLNLVAASADGSFKNKHSYIANHYQVAVLNSFYDVWYNIPPNWVGSDPCGDGWEGIGCINSYVISITLSSVGLVGTLSKEITTLSELRTLDLSYNMGLTGSLPESIGNLKKLTNLILVGCSFSGPIPTSIGSLWQLVFLSLNSNRFSGPIPHSIGNLSNLYWLDLADNQLVGRIPVSDGNSSGLDMLISAKHFHLGHNQLSGPIPDQLFSSNMNLIHVLLNNNKLTGRFPSTLGLVQTLMVIRFDRNSLSGPVPSNINNLTNVNELFLSNNNLTGPMPNLAGMHLLSYLDMSNNSFDAADIPSWFSTLQSLTTLMMRHTQLQGQVPSDLFSLSSLETVVLENNLLNGSLDIGTSHSNQLQLINLQNNFISSYTERTNASSIGLLLAGNPICDNLGESKDYCTVSQLIPTYSMPPKNCVSIPCSSDQISSPSCKCAYPYTGTIIFRAPSFSNLANFSYFRLLEDNMTKSFLSSQLPVELVSVSNAHKDSFEYLNVSLQIFPSSQDRFNRTGISRIGFVLSNQTYKPPPLFGPYFFIADPYKKFTVEPTGLNNTQPTDRKPKKSSSVGIIIGTSAGACVLLLLLAYAYSRKRRAERVNQLDPFGLRDLNRSNSAGIPELKRVRWFSFEELSKYTNSFSEDNGIGSGGYGKVYRGTLPTGQPVAIKRAQQGSIQGGKEFKTEIELLSRVHHKNVVSLLGFCIEKGEQILIYEYISNGSLKDSLSGKSGIRLDWITRLKIALGAARGLAYLHELANPPIIHRDIKSSNILLDDCLNAKVADFGISKLIDDTGKSHITTQIKGTLGYLDPEYYMSQKLTEKSDVYSFGVLMLELLTARGPIERENHIAREIKIAMDKEKDLYNLYEFLDPIIGLDTTLIGFEKYVDLAMNCVEESAAERPKMNYVVKKIEKILELAGPNSNADKHLPHDEEYSNEISITLPR